MPATFDHEPAHTETQTFEQIRAHRCKGTSIYERAQTCTRANVHANASTSTRASKHTIEKDAQALHKCLENTRANKQMGTCMSGYVRLHAHARRCTQMHAHARICARKNLCMRICPYMCTLTGTCARLRVRVHTCTDLDSHMYKCGHMMSSQHTSAPTLAHACTNAHWRAPHACALIHMRVHMHASVRKRGREEARQGLQAIHARAVANPPSTFFLPLPPLLSRSPSPSSSCFQVRSRSKTRT